MSSTSSRADKPDEALDTLGVLEDSVRSQNRWMAEESGLRWRFDTFTFTATHGGTGEQHAATAIDVSFVRSELPAAELDDGFAIRDELARLGFYDQDKRYLSYVAGGSGGVCGDAIAPILVAPDEVGDGKYAQVYLDSIEGCGARGFAQNPLEPSLTEAIAQHELVHNDGMVRLGAPHNCAISAFHICTGPLALYPGLDPEEPDLMYPFAGRSLAVKVLDRGRDDYFGDLPYRGLEASPYLEPAGTPGA